MSEINPSHLHWNSPAEARFKINPLDATAEVGPGERYRTRMELEPRITLHQLGFLRRAQQEEENGTLSIEQELRAAMSKQICPALHYGTPLKQPRGFQDVFDHAEPCLMTKGQLQVVSLQVVATGDAQARQLCFYPDGTWAKGDPQTGVERRAEGSCWQYDESASGVG